MPKRKDETIMSEVVRIRLSSETRNRCMYAREAGAQRRITESSFLAYLIELGLTRYEKSILPIETCNYSLYEELLQTEK